MQNVTLSIILERASTYRVKIETVNEDDRQDCACYAVCINCSVPMQLLLIFVFPSPNSFLEAASLFSLALSFSAASFSAFFLSNSSCLQFSSWAFLNILTKLSRVDTTAAAIISFSSQQMKTNLHCICYPTLTENQFLDLIYAVRIRTLKQIGLEWVTYLVQMGSVQDLLRNREPKHQHFFPRR